MYVCDGSDVVRGKGIVDKLDTNTEVTGSVILDKDDILIILDKDAILTTLDKDVILTIQRCNFNYFCPWVCNMMMISSVRIVHTSSK